MINTGHSLLLIGAMALCTRFLRFLPGIMFSMGPPKVRLERGAVLPNALIAMLVVYCLRNTDFTGLTHGIPEIVAVLSVIAVHKWRHNMILSILTGTVIYMILIRVM